MRAHVRLVDSPHYRKDAFCAGLESLGFKIECSPSADPKPGDCLVLWNRYQRDEHIARAYERAGAWVVIVENAPFAEDKPPTRYSFYLWHHNGAGVWHIGHYPRWFPDPQPWRTAGDRIVVLPQRGMGEPGVRMEKSWTSNIVRELRAATKREVTTRLHPGVRPHPEIDWSGTWAAVTWASGAALKALVAGIPVFYCFPKWVGAGAARLWPAEIERPAMSDRDRYEMLHRLSWAMWTPEEISKGEPFRVNFQDAYRRGGPVK